MSRIRLVVQRVFREELDTTSAKYIELIRFDLARASLDAGHTISKAAQRAGFTSTDSFRRAFTTRLGIAPSTNQHRFLNTISNQR